MPLSWNEIRQRAVTFARNWSSASRERAEAQTFWNEFFDVFGIRRRTVASFEEPVRNLSGDTEFIDLFWKGRLIAEHKSRGRDLSKAHTQAIDYIQNLVNCDRADECPRYILVSDFARLALHDLEADDSAPSLEFPLADLPRHVRSFAFIAGYETRRIDPEDPVNLKAVELLGNLHDQLEVGGYAGHDLQRFMVRILFCLFADDTGIFEPETFKQFLLDRTASDGSDLGSQLARFFGVLNTPEDRRQANLDESLAALPYVNGALFAEQLGFAEFNSAMRNALLVCAHFRWERISPAVFGSLFQAVMEPRERRQIGAHYTSERDILKLIRSLFLDDLRAEFESIRRDKRKLEAFHRRLGALRFLDPACGCGNFLVISYRELRRLEMDILDARFGKDLSEGHVRAECRLEVGQMFGIEIEEWPVRIAEVALWLMDHQMNAELFERFGQVKATTPLTRSPHIHCANALRIDWNDVLPASECSYVLGNPPFVGKQFMTAEQKGDMAHVCDGVTGSGTLDFVTAWYFVAARYIQDNDQIRVAFVSTNSITQGEQVGILWSELFRWHIQIHFGHRTFSWASEARGRAHVHVVIIGFGIQARSPKYIHDYDPDPSRPSVTQVSSISPYLIGGSSTLILSRSRPICRVPPIVFGSMPNEAKPRRADLQGRASAEELERRLSDQLLLDPEGRQALLAREPAAEKWLRRIYGSEEFINGIERWCLWLVNITPAELRAMPEVMKRVEVVRKNREESRRETTRELARTPYLFGEIRQPSTRYLLIPSVSSETRPYIPMGFMDPDVIASNLALTVSNATLYHFGVLSSSMHMAWVRQVCGRLKSDYRYSNKLVYNNYPWPQQPSDSQRQRVERAAQAVLDARAAFPDATLADLYDPLAMPAQLAKAHAELDLAVDRCYRNQPFDSDRQRVEFLFNLYEQLTAPLTPPPRRRSRRTRETA